MKGFIRQWRETGARRARLASLLAKFSEILFWLVVVGPFAIQPKISRGWWTCCAIGLAITSAGSYWYSRVRTGKEGRST